MSSNGEPRRRIRRTPRVQMNNPSENVTTPPTSTFVGTHTPPLYPSTREIPGTVQSRSSGRPRRRIRRIPRITMENIGNIPTLFTTPELAGTQTPSPPSLPTTFAREFISSAQPGALLDMRSIIFPSATPLPALVGLSISELYDLLVYQGEPNSGIIVPGSANRVSLQSQQFARWDDTSELFSTNHELLVHRPFIPDIHSMEQQELDEAIRLSLMIPVPTSRPVRTESDLDGTYQEVVSYPEPCSICLDEVNKNGQLLPCKHLFHRSCILESLLKCNDLCPNCRGSIVKSDLKSD